jgi:hypothetical protein
MEGISTESIVESSVPTERCIWLTCSLALWNIWSILERIVILMYFNPALAPGIDQPKTPVVRADRRQIWKK